MIIITYYIMCLIQSLIAIINGQRNSKKFLDCKLSLSKFTKVQTVK